MCRYKYTEQNTLDSFICVLYEVNHLFDILNIKFYLLGRCKYVHIRTVEFISGHVVSM